MSYGILEKYVKKMLARNTANKYVNEYLTKREELLEETNKSKILFC